MRAISTAAAAAVRYTLHVQRVDKRSQLCSKQKYFQCYSGRASKRSCFI